MVLDIGHQWGGDLDVGPTGDLAVVAGAPAVTQRILRRLLTNPGDYIWNLGYGAGLPGFVGTAVSSVQIAAIVRPQMLLETGVAVSPAPDIVVSTPEWPGMGTFELTVQYVDTDSRQLNNISLPIAG
jgi:hypothetical protein